MGLIKGENGGTVKPSVSVIIPTYNEAKNLPLILPYIPRDVVNEVIVVDGRSKDFTAEIARQLMPDVRVIMETRPGKGAAMKCGYREATGDILVVMDADGSNDPREIPRFVKALMEGADFVKGSRFASSGGTTDMPRIRKLGNWGFVVLTNLLFSKKFTDLAYGYHAFWRHVLDDLELDRVDGFEIDASIYLQAMRKNLKVVEVPSFEGFRFYGVGKLKTFPDGWRILKTIMHEWTEGIRHPAPEPQVGFRSYGVNPALNANIGIPVTGSDTAYPLNGQQRTTISPLKSCCVGDLFKLNVVDLFSDEAEPFLQTTLISAMENMGASSGGFVLFDTMNNAVHGCRAFGRTFEHLTEDEITAAVERGTVGWVAKNRQPAVIVSTITDPRWVNHIWEKEQDVSRTALAVPLYKGDRIAGVMTITRPADRPFMEEDVNRLMTVQVKL